MFIFLHTHPIQYFAPLYRYLTAQGLQLEVWYMDTGLLDGAQDPEFNQKIAWDIPLLEGYTYRFFDNKGGGTRSGKAERGFWSYRSPGLRAALRALPPSMIVVHGWNYHGYVQVLRHARRYGHRLAFRGETNLLMERSRPLWQQTIRRLILRRLLSQVDAFLYIGSHSKAFYTRLGVPENRLYFTPYAVDNQRFRSVMHTHSRAGARAQLGLPAGVPLVLFSGKYIPKKRPVDVLEAFEHWQHPDAVLVMMGEGALRGRMESWCAGHSSGSRVILTGFINQQQVPLYYLAADMLVMSSDYGETWGLSVNEAMNLALPLILSDRTGCAPDLVREPRNGYIYTTGDTEQLASRLRTWCALPEQEREAMGLYSQQLADEYSFAAIHRALTALQTR